MMYEEEVIDHAKNPQNMGKLSGATHEHKEVNASCGDVFEVQIKISGQKVVEIVWGGEGCALMTAMASMMTDDIKGKKIGEILDVNDGEWVENIIGEVNPGRAKCVLLPVVGIKKALK